MKKSLLLILASLFAVFALTGCAEDSKNDSPAVTPPTVVTIDPTNPEALRNLLGYYEITFFYTSGAGLLPLSSDCTLVSYYTGTADEKCVQGTNNVEMKGYGVVTVDQTMSNIQVATKMQMTNQYLQDPSKAGATSLYWSMAQNNQYNYTVFNSIPVTAIEDNAINNGVYAVKGVTGRNLKYNTTDSEATYKFELLSDGSIRNTMVDYSSGIGAAVTVIMKKIDTLPEGYNLDGSTQFPLPEITGFSTNPTPAQ